MFISEKLHNINFTDAQGCLCTVYIGVFPFT